MAFVMDHTGPETGKTGETFQFYPTYKLTCSEERER